MLSGRILLKLLSGIALPAALLLIPVATNPSASARQDRRDLLRGEDLRELPYISISLDGKPLPLTPVYEEMDSTLVPLEQTLRLLLKSQVELRTNDETCQVRVDGRRLVDLPLTDVDRRARIVLDGDNERLVDLYDSPLRVAGAGGERLYMDLQTLTGLLGFSYSEDNSNPARPRVSLLSPEFWCQKLNLPAEGRTIKNLTLLPRAGVSPPMKTLLLWVRARTSLYVQCYNLANVTPQPLVGQDRLGNWIDFPIPGADKIASKPVARGATARIQTEFTDAQRMQMGSYAFVITKSAPRGELLDAIRRNDFGDRDWCVIGLRQSPADLPVQFDLKQVPANTILRKIAEDLEMPVEMLAELNGLDPQLRDQPLRAGDTLAYIKSFSPGKNLKLLDGYDARLYAVRRGDSVESLAKKCQVTAQLFYQANTSVPIGGDLKPGEIVYLLHKKDSPAPPPTSQPALAGGAVESVTGFGSTKVSADLLESPEPGAKPVTHVGRFAQVSVTGKMASYYHVEWGNVSGYLPVDAVKLRQPLQRTVPGPDYHYASNQAMGRVVETALRYRGTPYRWGMSSLERGIDCSHFVEAVYSKAQQPAPPAPVHEQEKFGTIVHRRPDTAAEAGGPLLPKPTPFQTRMSNLQAGDRLIFQRNPYHNYDGNHHTAIYMGNYAGKSHAFIHASSKRGVTVSELEPGNYYWSIYRYALRGSQRVR